MWYTKKRLRSCSAQVYTCHVENDEEPRYVLQSYSTIVAECFYAHDGSWNVYVYPAWDCSTTTMSHVRKFIEDCTGVSTGIVEMRNAMKNGIRGHIGRIMKNGETLYVADNLAREGLVWWLNHGERR